MKTADIILKALSHDGFGKPDYYEEEFVIENSGKALDRLIKEFAMKYGVMLSQVEVEVVR